MSNSASARSLANDDDRIPGHQDNAARGEDERLHQVIIGAFVECAHAFLDGIASREDEDRDVAAALNRGDDDLSVLVWQSKVENDRAQSTSADASNRVARGTHRFSGEAFLAEPFDETRGQAALIFDDEYGHDESVPVPGVAVASFAGAAGSQSRWHDDH